MTRANFIGGEEGVEGVDGDGDGDKDGDEDEDEDKVCTPFPVRRG